MKEIITKNNISVDDSILKEIDSELVSMNRESFMSSLVSRRMDSINSSYMDEFNIIMDNILQSAERGDVHEILRLTKRVSQITNNIYNTQIRVLLKRLSNIEQEYY